MWKLKHGKFGPVNSTDGNLDLGVIITQWGNSWCQNGGSSMSEVSTGPWSSDPSPRCGCRIGENTWCTYQDYGYKCMGYDTAITGINYDNATASQATPFIFEEWFDNGANSSSVSTFSHTEAIDNIYSVTMSATVAASWSMSFSVGIPDICQVNDQFSINISVTDSHTQTTTHSVSWSVSEQITIPPLSTIHAVMTVSKMSYNAPFRAAVNFDGVGMTWCNNQVNGHWLWFPQPSDLFSVGAFPCENNADNSANCNLNGTFVGLQGVEVHVNVTQCPLNTRCGRINPL